MQDPCRWKLDRDGHSHFFSWRARYGSGWVSWFSSFMGMAIWLSIGSVTFASATEVPGPQAQAAIQAVRQYAEAVAAGDPVGIAQQDFVCLLNMVQDRSVGEGTFPPPSNPVYTWCRDRLAKAHTEVIESKDRGLDELWPGKGTLVNFTDFKRFLIAETGSRQLAPSFFVMNPIGAIAGAPGFRLEPLGTGPLPHASFRIHEGDPVVAVPTTLVRVKIHYPDPITSPVANAPGQQDWAVPYKKPIHPVRGVIVKWVVLSGLQALGFPTDIAVLNIPQEGSFGTTIPFVVEAGGYEPKSTKFWGPGDAPEALDAGMEQARSFSEHRQRISMLNRVLAVNPEHERAVRAISQELYEGLLAYGARLHGVEVAQAPLAQRFDELYWTVQSQTDRMDISLGMEMGGKPEPTPADYLYAMIPAMERLADLQPGDFQNRLRLSLAYRWTNDQLTAIMTPQQLLTEVPSEQRGLRARILLTLAWSRISKVAWNRQFDDPDIVRGFEEAEEAFQLTDDPLDKFTAAYAQAYSLAFRPQRDNKEMLTLLTEARRWFKQVPGATQQSWNYLLQNNTLKGLVETDPAFQSLLASSS